MQKDDDGVEYLESHFFMHYRPFVNSREEKAGWTGYHLLEDFGK